MPHFEVQVKRGERSDYGGSVKDPSVFPSFVLVFNDTWNDYSYYTWFCLYYYDKERVQHKIGELKLMCRGQQNAYDALPQTFDTPLGEDYCSLGMSISYYNAFRALFGKDDELYQALQYLRDSAVDDNIKELFENDDQFKDSLCRDLDSMNALKHAKYVITGKKRNEAYKFVLRFKPEYLDGLYTDWDVAFETDAPDYLRCAGLIGENGVGKTQMLKCLASNLVDNKGGLDETPQFGSCLVLCSTPYDGYDEIAGNSQIMQYTALCLEQNRERTIENLRDNLNTILHHRMYQKVSMPSLFKSTLSETLGAELAEILSKEGEGPDERWKLNEDQLVENVKIMSSGQLQIMTLITYVFANIHLSSLILIDEPEVHLHPHFINIFMQKLGQLLEQFKSYAIIATHSPLVVREMVGRNVYLMQTLDNGGPMVAKVDFETFGADAADLYRNIFEYDERTSLCHGIMRRLVKEEGYEDALEELRTVAPNLGINALLALRDINNQKG